ncbi:hypothetical protein K490DRAFT_65794 [Saccharata proteae CBS 121410]|uniref:C3H1-type domain-containing protein n=1 Tax=Saccharata proteae CBS 121410 TaxID=1314787 RepID=A0A9P4LYS8_9PEZI|nr:hypothetical protein K490DRAFT_65794 [Saccharata proteae CBS 121410]
MVKLATLAILTASVAVNGALAAPAAAATTTTTNTTALDAILAYHKAAAMASHLSLNSSTHATNNATPSLTERDTSIPTTGVYYCNKNDFKGHCQYDHGPLNECHDFGSAYSAKVNSFGPEKTTWWPNVGNYRCELFMSKKCKGPMVPIEYPGKTDLLAYLQKADSKVWWDDGDMGIMQTVRSYKCLNHS